MIISDFAGVFFRQARRYGNNLCQKTRVALGVGLDISTNVCIGIKKTNLFSAMIDVCLSDSGLKLHPVPNSTATYLSLPDCINKQRPGALR